MKHYERIIIQEVHVYIKVFRNIYCNKSFSIKQTYCQKKAILAAGFTPSPCTDVRSWEKSKTQKMLQLSWCSHRSSTVWNSHRTAPFHTETMRRVGEPGEREQSSVVQKHRSYCFVAFHLIIWKCWIQKGTIQNNPMICMYQAAWDTPNMKSGTDWFNFIIDNTFRYLPLPPQMKGVSNNKYLTIPLILVASYKFVF